MGVAFLCVHVQIALESLLCPGFFLSHLGKEALWIQFRYERISEWCTLCGRLGHAFRHCSHEALAFDGPQEALLNLLATKMQ